MTAFRTRIVRQRPKRGQKVELLHPPTKGRAREVSERIDRALDNHGPDISGFAFIVWGPDTGSTVAYEMYQGAIATALIPDFVRARLMLRIAEEWSNSER